MQFAFEELRKNKRTKEWTLTEGCFLRDFSESPCILSVFESNPQIARRLLKMGPKWGRTNRVYCISEGQTSSFLIYNGAAMKKVRPELQRHLPSTN